MTVTVLRHTLHTITSVTGSTALHSLHSQLRSSLAFVIYSLHSLIGQSIRLYTLPVVVYGRVTVPATCQSDLLHKTRLVYRSQTLMHGPRLSDCIICLSSVVSIEGVNGTRAPFKTFSVGFYKHYMVHLLYRCFQLMKPDEK